MGKRGEMGGKERREEREIGEKGEERRARPGTLVHHQVSALTNFN